MEVKAVNLVKQAQKGNDQAFLQLFQQYEQEIYKMAFIYVKNESDALDVVQETAYAAFKNIKKLREPQYVKTWLIKIAIRCAIDILRKQQKTVPLELDYSTEEVEEQLDLQISLQDVMLCLNEHEKSIILLRFYEDMTIKEVAAALDIPLGSAKTILYRTLQKLRKRMEAN
ncbi:MAG TPA: sigma-70 family RNA polymerase sigma factor [Candidatus Kurthia intestinigallinarum]|nr:sigma-70 family RNA polymerase sigma factor [Candidatus Kurthia intestinigallinarum]